MKKVKRPSVQKSRYSEGSSLSPWREALHTIIFGSETRSGKTFDVVLIISIIISITAVMMSSVESFRAQHQQVLHYIEWAFTLLFTVEYLLRLICVRKPWLYFRSFFGLVDLLSILPTYLALFFPGTRFMMVIRVFRLLRIFRVFKLAEYMDEAQVLVSALVTSSRKIMVFLYAVLTLAIVFGSLMYVVEGREAGFTSIPKSVYWSIVTLTTVGYGDIAPQTTLGQFIAAIIMIMGYGIIAVPTGIYSVELVKSYNQEKISNNACPDCGETGHDIDASFCKYCGYQLNDS
jgi:voltage-gated potassium channel